MTKYYAPLGVVLGSTSRNAGGLFNSVRRLTQNVQNQGMHAIIHSLRDAHSAEDASAWGELTLALSDTSWPHQLGYSTGIYKSISNASHEILHQHGIWQGFSISIRNWARKNNKPVIISPRGMLDPWALSNSSWKKRISSTLYESSNLRESACLHALNESERLSIRRLGLTNPIAVIPNGIDTPPPTSEIQPPWTDEIKDSSRVILFIGRIHPKKGLDLFIKAMSECTPRSSDWHLVVAGWDQDGHLNHLKRLATELSISSRVHFIGPLYGDKKWAALQHANAFVLPSHSEGLPMSVLEAWASGLPVLMTHACNLPEGEIANAAISVNTNILELREGFSNIIEMSDDQRKIMGEAGRALVSNSFTWDVIAKKMHGTYSWILNGGKTPSWIDSDA